MKYLTMMCVVCLIGYLGFQQIGTSNNVVENISLSSPEESLFNYWKAAYEKNSDLLNLVSSGNVESVELLGDCSVDIKNSKINLVKEKSDYLEDIEVVDKTIFKGDDLPDSIEIMASFINANRINWKQINILKKRNYKNQALLEVKIAEKYKPSQNYETFAFAFKKINNKWKLGSILQTNILGTLYEDLAYANPDFVCKY